MTSPKTPKTPTPTIDLATTLARIGLRATATSLDDVVSLATRSGWSPRVLLEQIAHDEAQDQSRRSLERRVKRSRIGRFKPMADFNWSWPDKIDRALVESAVSLDFLRAGRNLVLIGDNGLGKTMIAKNIAHEALLAGYSVLFRTAPELLDDLAVDSPDLRRRKVHRYVGPGLLCLDEVGYLSYDDHAADLLYRVVNPRYDGGRSTLVTTNLVFTEWNTVFPGAACLRTLVDRLTHHADVTLLEGKSFRAHESQQESASRRNKRSGAGATAGPQTNKPGSAARS
jgi:DNA replication protein DnaC